MTTTPRPVAAHDVRPCRAAGEHQRATRHTRAECSAHDAAIAIVTVARDDAWGRVLEAEPGTPEHTATTAALDAARSVESRVRAGEPVMLPGLTLRTDGRYEVHDTATANAAHGCRLDTECILARWHDGPCEPDREHDAHSESLDGPDLTRVRLTKTGVDLRAPWELWVPHRGPFVEHIALTDRYDLDAASDAYLTDDDSIDLDDAPLLDAFGTTYHESHEDAVEVLRALERQYPRPTPSRPRAPGGVG